jgi:hypothetical protein
MKVLHLHLVELVYFSVYAKECAKKFKAEEATTAGDFR